MSQIACDVFPLGALFLYRMHRNRPQRKIKMITTIIPKTNDQDFCNAKNLGGAKEKIAALSLIVLDKNGAPLELAAVRFYQSRTGDDASPVYCSIWIFGGEYRSGYGVARGYGYDKKNAALTSALNSAGIVAKDSGASCSDILSELGKFLGYNPNTSLVISH